MTIWMRRFLGFWAMAGGAIGLGSVFPSILRFQQLAPVHQIVLACTVAIFAWGVWCGIRMLEGHPAAIRGNRNFWLIQIPVLHTPLLSYALFGGLQLTLKASYAPLRFGVDWNVLGAQLTADLGGARGSYVVGVNAFALVVVLYLNGKVKR